MSDEQDVCALVLDIHAKCLLLGSKYNSSLGYCLAGIIANYAEDPSVVRKVSKFLLGEIVAKQRLN